MDSKNITAKIEVTVLVEKDTYDLDDMSSIEFKWVMEQIIRKCNEYKFELMALKSIKPKKKRKKWELNFHAND